ncbi:ATP-grasp domain-containing protein [Methanobrevibacter sp.]|uniref:ATP-grasp domain-containing protein n=1 Tax=Methanobrevibacter sp. TaxID=66852 RepID=UPI0025DB016A|nr:ATP-grasp domain-containing protein [Methanobrevibacter sp.]MBQ2962641.1 ATP-grasp domain-containing protein [Methanobrevibacter sp.]
MENLLLMGIDTRPMVNSALKLDYRTFSISYFKTVDFKMPYSEKHVLNQESIISCGRFEDNYSPSKLFELFEDLLHENDNDENHKKYDIDKIVLTTGLNVNDFSGKFKKYRKIVRGNKNTENVENKFKFYNKLKNKFNVPLTFQPVDVGELNEILQQHINNQFILKPIQGSGGLGIFLLNNESCGELKQVDEICQNISLENYILQEYIEGTNVSSSVLSSHDDRKNIINSRLITEHDLCNDSYEYSGNILPLNENSFKMFNDNRTINGINIDELNDEMKNISEDLMKEFGLVGSNGVDYILDNDGELKIIEINPRFQGTYELVENVLGINLLDAHIKACEGEMIDIPNPNQYSVKKIIYARKQVDIGNLNIPNVYDIPYQGVKIEKDQPMVTLISSNKDLETALNDIKIAEEEVYRNID